MLNYRRSFAKLCTKSLQFTVIVFYWKVLLPRTKVVHCIYTLRWKSSYTTYRAVGQLFVRVFHFFNEWRIPFGNFHGGFGSVQSSCTYRSPERNGRSDNSSGGIAMGSHAEWWQKRLPRFHVPNDGSNRSNRKALPLYALQCPAPYRLLLQSYRRLHWKNADNFKRERVTERLTKSSPSKITIFQSRNCLQHRGINRPLLGNSSLEIVRSNVPVNRFTWEIDHGVTNFAIRLTFGRFEPYLEQYHGTSSLKTE